jgi:hypothetical protein
LTVSLQLRFRLRANFNINLSSFLYLFFVIILFCFASCILSFKSSICLIRAFRCFSVNTVDDEVFEFEVEVEKELVEESTVDNETDDEDSLNRGGVANSAAGLVATNTASDDDDDDIGVVSADAELLLLVTDDVLTVPPDADADTDAELLLSKLMIVSTVATVDGVDETSLLKDFFLYEDDFNIPCWRWGDLIGKLLLLLIGVI